MAPDLNSVPPSPRISLRTSLSAARRTSQPMAPPPAPLSSTPMNTHLPSANLPATPVGTSIPTTADNTGVGMGPGNRRLMAMFGLLLIWDQVHFVIQDRSLPRIYTCSWRKNRRLLLVPLISGAKHCTKVRTFR